MVNDAGQLHTISPVSSNVLIIDEDTGEVIYSAHNTATTAQRVAFARFIAGLEVSLPRYVAFGPIAALSTDSITRFTALKAEAARSPIGTVVTTTTETARVGVTFGPGIGSGDIREIGLLNDEESASTIHNCDILTNWTTSVGTISLDTEEFVQGFGAVIIESSRGASEAAAFTATPIVINLSSFTSPYLQFWYYIEDAAHIAEVDVELRDGTTRYDWSDVLPVSGTLEDGWNYYSLSIGSGTATSDTNDGRVQITTTTASTVAAATSIVERIDNVRLWAAQGDLWAYLNPTPFISKHPRQTLGVYWFLSITDATTTTATMAEVLTSFGSEQLTVGTSVKTLSSVEYSPLDSGKARTATIQVTAGGPVRYQTDGSTPSATSGLILRSSDNDLVLDNITDIGNMRMIRNSGGSDATIDVTYHR